MRYTFRRLIVYEEEVAVEAPTLEAAVYKLGKDKFEFINMVYHGVFKNAGVLGVLHCKRQDGERVDEVPADVLKQALDFWAEETGISTGSCEESKPE